MFGRFVALSVAEVVAAGRDVDVIARSGFDEVGGPKRAIEILALSSCVIELSERNCRPGHIADRAALKERQASGDVDSVAVGYASEVCLAEPAVIRRVILLSIEESIANNLGAW